MSIQVDHLHIEVYRLFEALESGNRTHAVKACLDLAMTASKGGYSGVAYAANIVMAGVRDQQGDRQSLSHNVGALARLIEDIIDSSAPC